MAVKLKRSLKRAYGLDNALQELSPVPIIATRAPTSRDTGPLGTSWINKSTNIPYTLTSVTANSANWSTSPSAGSTTLADLTVTTTADIGTDFTVGGTSGFTGAATFVDISISGTFAYGGSGAIDWTTAADQTDAIKLEATAGGIDILASGASAGEDIDIIATGSSVNISATEAHADAIKLSASAGGVNVDGALQVNIASSQNAADALVLSASAGGIDITAEGASGEDLDLVCTSGSTNITSGEVIADSMVLTSAGGLDIAVSGAGALDIDMVNTSGSINITAGESAADSIVITSSIGGIDILAAGAAAGEDIDIVATGSSVHISASENVADAITLTASAGGIDITNTGTAGEDIDIASSGASVNISSTENAALALTLITNGGASETIVITNTQGTDAAAIDINATAGGVAVDAAGAISLDAAAASNFTTSGAGIDIDIISGSGRLIMTSGEDAPDSIYLHANAGVSEVIRLHSDLGTGADSVHLESDVGGVTLTSGFASTDAINLSASAGGIDVNAALEINIDSSEAAVTDAVRIVASAGDGGIDIDAGTGGIAIDSTGAVSIQGAAASDFSVSGAGIDLDFASASGRVIVTAGEDAVQAIYLHANAGTSETIDIHSDLGNTDTSINIRSDVGGVTLDGNTGNIHLVPGTNTAAGVSLTLNTKVGAATFTGQTTASGAQEAFTITNSEVGATSAMIVTVTNVGANDARMSLEQVKQAGGSFVVNTQNNGAAALNGNVVISWIVLN